MFPMHLGDLRRRMAFFISGGPLASLLTALLSFLTLLAMPGSAWQTWWRIPALVAAMSAAAMVENLIPFGFAAGFSDGGLLIQLLRGGPFADLRIAMAMFGSMVVSATRPRDLDVSVLAKGLRAGAGTLDEGTLRMIEVICAVDRGELDLAREHLEASVGYFQSPEKAPSAGCAAEISFYIAYLDGNTGRAESWLQGAEQLAATKKTPLTDDFDYWLALTAIREAEGRPQEADEAWRRATELNEQKPPNGLRQFDRDLLQRVQAREWLRLEGVGPDEIGLENLAAGVRSGDGGSRMIVESGSSLSLLDRASPES